MWLRRNKKNTAWQLVRLESRRCAAHSFIEHSSRRELVIPVVRKLEMERVRE